MSESTTCFAYAATVLAILGVTFYCNATFAEGWELTSIQGEVPGTRYVESGEFEKAIRVSNRFLYRVTSKHAPIQQRVAVLTNLCIAYIALYEYEQAEIFCRRAAAEPRSRSVTVNNLGVLSGLRGDHALAARYFEIAANSDCLGKCRRAEGVPRALPRPTAHRNLDRARSFLRAEGEAYVASTDGSTVEEIEMVLP